MSDDLKDAVEKLSRDVDRLQGGGSRRRSGGPGVFEVLLRHGEFQVMLCMVVVIAIAGPVAIGIIAFGRWMLG